MRMSSDVQNGSTVSSTSTACQRRGVRAIAVGDRIADDEQHQRGEGGDLQALDVGQNVERIGAEQQVIVERQPSAKNVRKPCHPAARSSTGV